MTDRAFDGVPPAPGRFLKIGEVVREVGLSRPQIYRLIRSGDFPRQIRLSPQRVAWTERDVEHWKLRQLNHQN
ncbi:helix-turn-helix transcriptional regulator [Novosphingobium aquimarinum]|uniref:helix-turn-helix transcriptional regulator n=1 Tax=Novosphingobium aquimarinum TaxID=2682494 RepID=UPI0012EBA459|nr:AlpA family phage regulatory protein [Novosphingobium aquimarinum]